MHCFGSASQGAQPHPRLVALWQCPSLVLLQGLHFLCKCCTKECLGIHAIASFKEAECVVELLGALSGWALVG